MAEDPNGKWFEDYAEDADARHMSKLLLAALLVIGLGLCVGCGKNTEAEPTQSADGFTHFTKLNQFIGVECYWTDPLEDVYPIGQAGSYKIPTMSKVVIDRVIDGGTDFAHPDAQGYKMYLKYEGVTYVGYPRMSDKKNGEFSMLGLCPVSDFNNVKSKWEGKKFKYPSTKLGDIEVEEDTVVTLTNITSDSYGDYVVDFVLPNGTKVHSFIRDYDLTHDYELRRSISATR